MSHGVRLHRVAQRELDEATEYYDSEGPGLGFAFLDEVERALRQISAFPESSPVALGPVRRKVISAFPCSVTYSLIDEVIVVLAFAHYSRQPFYWRGREPG